MASIYYTTDGSSPTTGSPLYSGPFTIDASTTVHAIAIATGYTQSAQGSASYTYTPTESAAATPTFSPGAGTYTSTQSVTIADTTPGATIYFTTNATTPSTSSAVYSSAIPVSASMTLEAIAVAPGYTQSALATAAYVIQSSGTSTINFAAGFPSATGLQLNGSAAVNSSKFLELTNGGTAQASSAFWTTPVNIQAFTTNFTFQLSSAAADGFTFTIQNAGTTALGGSGGGLGYGPDPGATGTASIAKSVAIKFDLYNNSGEGTDSTGIYTNGATPTVPAVDLTSSGIVLSSGDTISAQLVYNGTTLTLNLTDTVTNDTFSYAFTLNIPSTVGANTAYVGFTAGTGGETAIQNIKNWTLTSGTTQVTAAATPTFTPASGTSFSSPMSVSIAMRPRRHRFTTLPTEVRRQQVLRSTRARSPLAQPPPSTLSPQPAAIRKAPRVRRAIPTLQRSRPRPRPLFPLVRHLYLEPVSHHRRHHPRSDDLLHHQRDRANHFLCRL